nr:tetranectin-like protein [Drosophila takahashii]
MTEYKNYFFVKFFGWTLCSILAQSQDSCSVCILKDAPNQCGAFCLAALHPLYDQMAEMREKLDKIETQQIAIQTMIENQEKDFKNKLDKMESSLNINTTSQYKDLQETLIRIYTKVFNLKNFERIGSRHFYIQNDVYQDWTTAEKSCQQMVAHLVSFKKQEEFDALNLKIKQNLWFWVGINDISEEGKYISVDTNKTANFLDWNDGQPNNLDSNENCVAIGFGKMYYRKCDEVSRFICVSNDSF